MMKLGIVGSGKIVIECLQAIQSIDAISCTAICVREHSRDKAQALADEYHIPAIFTDYAEFLADADIDILYIGIVNSEHYAYSLQALQAGRHVICEKPFTSTCQELETLVELAKRQNLFLFEAITMLYCPNFQYIRQNLAALGDIKLVQCNYSQYSSRYDQYLAGKVLPAFDPALSGGALYDINVYNIHFVTALFGRPQHVHYLANTGFNGIDTSGVVILKYPTFSAVCSGAKDSQSPSFATVQGTRGYLQLTSAPNTALGVISAIKGELDSINLQHHDQHMYYEFKAFAELFAANDLASCHSNLDHSLDVLSVLTDARADAGIVFAADHCNAAN